MKSREENFNYTAISNEDIERLVVSREGEKRLGEVCTGNEKKRFVIFGVEESVGPVANLGKPGAENGFEHFLSTFLNIQSNRFLLGKSVKVEGRIQCLNHFSDISKNRTLVEELDEFIVNILEKYVKEDQIPIIVGGGHNNAFPLMKFAYKRLKKAINVVNLDPHADYRKQEGRHSGNAFSYAFDKSYLEKYHVVGLHENYNSEEMLTRLEKDGHFFTMFEDYLVGLRNINNDFVELCKMNMDTPLGIEMDMDAIIDMPSSARTPSGVTLERARIYIKTVSNVKNVAYLHIPEAAPSSPKENATVGKALSYLVSDFIKTVNSVSLEK